MIGSILPAWAYRQVRYLSLAAVAAGLAAWALEWTGAVEPCAYCQVQRTIIIMLGLLGLLSPAWGWPRRLLIAILAVFGVVTAATQHMNNWVAWTKGEWAPAPIWGNSFLLSACALLIIVAQWHLLSAGPEDRR